MANSPIPNEGLKDLLKPFYQRASEAEDRLSKIENVVSSRKGISEAGNEECSGKMKEFESKIEQLTADLAAEREKNSKLTAENSKLTAENVKKDYRIIHLVRSLKETDLKKEQLMNK